MNNKIGTTFKKYRFDIIIISALVVISLLVLLIINITKKEGTVAVVEIDGMICGEYPLDNSGVYPLNNGTNVLVIEENYAYLNYSSCPDHICENTGKIRYVGETIVCLPNRLSITIRGAGEGVDFVS